MRYFINIKVKSNNKAVMFHNTGRPNTMMLRSGKECRDLYKHIKKFFGDVSNYYVGASIGLAFANNRNDIEANEGQEFELELDESNSITLFLSDDYSEYNQMLIWGFNSLDEIKEYVEHIGQFYIVDDPFSKLVYIYFTYDNKNYCYDCQDKFWEWVPQDKNK